MSADDYINFPPGTHMLEDQRSNENDKKEIILNPTPSDDPDDPLNWSTLRKTVNFGLTGTYVLFTFVVLEIGSVAQKTYEGYLHLGLAAFNQSAGASYGSLAIGCLILIPCVHKFGRRPVYLISAVLQFAAAIWYANFTTAGEMIAIGLLSGIAGSACEAIVMITIADLFFVHQHARMNGVFIFMQSLGTLGGPIAGGYILSTMKPWRWMWWITAILVGCNLLLVLFFFEESKYVPRSRSTGNKISKRNEYPDTNGFSSSDSGEKPNDSNEPPYDSNLESQTYPRKSYRQRLALVTKTDVPILQNFYRPLITPFLFPAVAFTAIQYGLIQTWFSATSTAGGYLLPKPPYNFQPNDIGLFNIGGFIGVLLAAGTVPFLSDWLVVWQSRRNKGVFEPEMRLWLLFPALLLNSVGSWIYGIGLARYWPWINLAVGNAIFGFGFMITADVCLTYLTDCYPLILNDALISVVFIRNGLAMIVRFAFTDWFLGMGTQNTFVLIGVISLVSMIMPALLVAYGKSARIHTAHKYVEFAAHQQAQRPDHQQRRRTQQIS
ncbi:Major facilitator superfamily domain general substrate transporter [Penicillium riverlandense]|uniref:Major facilitator superfamily domain general substrate transporter n=1 Tax=Penicillium riverlandense TaxID=1903569 RepID=UPI0025484F56|nr:Major facilitator superfamily domain general substrate transporter [Penicillium riverlandense]KAJ5808757.1 Major facilitator superfamily domain general substrate transporter [Penicillium riverlandense]